MNKMLIILSIFISSYVLCAENKAVDTTAKKWNKLEKLITNEIKMIEGLKAYGPTMRFRLFELYAEQLKIQKEKENRVFIGKSNGEKRTFFKKSQALYKKTSKIGKLIEKESPNYAQIGEVYYILAINSRDYDQGKETLKYLHKALAKSNLSPKTKHNVTIALAERYYNDKKYQNAIHYYKSVITNEDDQWRAKHYYNLSWCLFKTKRQEQSIKGLYKAYRLSNEKKYLSVKDEVLDALSIFHINGGNIDEVIDFYSKELENPTEYLIKLAQRASKKGIKDGAQKALTRALESSIQRMNHLDEQNIRLESLYIYRSFSNNEKYLENAEGLKSLALMSKINNDYKNPIIEELNSYTGYVQERFIKEYHQSNESYSKEQLDEVIHYFNIIIAIDNSNTPKYRYFQGETFYAVKEYTKASNYYIKGINKAIPNKESVEMNRKLLDALLAGISLSDLEEKSRKSYLKYTYKKYIDFFPQDEKTRAIMPKLSLLYLSDKKINEAQETLNSYISSFPQDIETQREVQTKIIDFHIEKKDSYALASWIERMKKGHLGFDMAYQKKAMIILGNILFQEIDGQVAQGHQKASHSYKKLFEDEHYPLQIREEAAHNASVLLLKNRDTEGALLWVKKGNKIRDHKQKLKYRDNHIAMLTQFFILQDFKSSIELSKDIQLTYCKEQFSEKEEIFKRHFFLAMEELSPKTLAKEFSELSKCDLKQDFVADVEKEIRTQLFSLKKYRHYSYFTRGLKATGDQLEFSLSHALYWESRISSSERDALNALNLLKRTKKESKITEKEIKIIDNIVAFERFEKEISTWRDKSRFEGKKETFDESEFNKALEQTFAELAEWTKASQVFVETNAPNIAVGSYFQLAETYRSVGKQLIDLQVKHEDKHFIISFKKQMKKMGTNLLTQATKYNKMAKDQIDIHNLITPYNHALAARLFKTNVENFYPASNKVLTFDAI